ncbi:MAG: universal stress protein [Acidobacteriota bacterium]
MHCRCFLHLRLQVLEDEHKQGKAAVERAASRLRTGEGSRLLEITTEVLEGSPKEPIVDEAKRCGADLIVVGSHGRRRRDEFERDGVIFADRAQSRLFTVHLGKIEEHCESFAPGEVKIIKAPGRDLIRSDMRFQRKADQYAYRHLKRVAELTVEPAGRHALDRLLLAGPVEATSQVHHFLPKQWQSRIVASLELPVKAEQHAVLAATVWAAEGAERNGEIWLVEKLL